MEHTVFSVCFFLFFFFLWKSCEVSKIHKALSVSLSTASQSSETMRGVQF